MNDLKILVIFDQSANERGEDLLDIREKRFAYDAVEIGDDSDDDRRRVSRMPYAEAAAKAARKHNL